MKDSSGRKLSRQQQSRPRWPGPYPVYVAGFRIIRHLGFFRYQCKKGGHKYLVECTICGNECVREQTSLSRGEAKGTKGCLSCARERHNEDKRLAKLNSDRNIRKALDRWLWVLFSIPVASLEYRKPFDSEKLRFTLVE